MVTNLSTCVVLLVSLFITIIMSQVILKKSENAQLRISFASILICLSICDTGLLAQLLLSERFNISPIYFDYFVYIGTCFLPVTIYFMSLIFSKTKIVFKKRYLLLLIIPITTLIVLWTNDLHHLFYVKYSTNIAETEYGNYVNVHTLYTYGLLIVGLINLIKFSVKNAGFFSRQSLLIIIRYFSTTCNKRIRCNRNNKYFDLYYTNIFYSYNFILCFGNI